MKSDPFTHRKWVTFLLQLDHLRGVNNWALQANQLLLW